MDSPWPVCVGNLLVEFGYSLLQTQREAGAHLCMHMLPVGWTSLCRTMALLYIPKGQPGPELGSSSLDRFGKKCSSVLGLGNCHGAAFGWWAKQRLGGTVDKGSAAAARPGLCTASPAGCAAARGCSAFVHTEHHPWSSHAPHLGELLAECTYPICRPKSVTQLHWTFLQIYPLGLPALKRGTWLLPCSAQTTHGKTLGEAVLEPQENRGFPQGFFWVVLHHFGCCAVLCMSAPAEKSGLEAVRSNLKGKWLFLEFHREEADIGSLKQDTRRDIMYCLEKRVVGRSTNPPCTNGS